MKQQQTLNCILTSFFVSYLDLSGGGQQHPNLTDVGDDEITFDLDGALVSFVSIFFCCCRRGLYRLRKRMKKDEGVSVGEGFTKRIEKTKL